MSRPVYYMPAEWAPHQATMMEWPTITRAGFWAELFDRAKAEEEGARKMAGEKLILQAAEQYILSAFLFEKAKEVALESAQAGRD